MWFHWWDLPPPPSPQGCPSPPHPGGSPLPPNVTTALSNIHALLDAGVLMLAGVVGSEIAKQALPLARGASPAPPRWQRLCLLSDTPKKSSYLKPLKNQQNHNCYGQSSHSNPPKTNKMKLVMDNHVCLFMPLETSEAVLFYIFILHFNFFSSSACVPRLPVTLVAFGKHRWADSWHCITSGISRHTFGWGEGRRCLKS